MLSDLSPGDKLSLKGKIFELQKKLQIIDIRNKQKEVFSYKPTLYNYDLPDRDNNVLDSINKAEIIRKQKKDMLKAAVLLQSVEGCTFAPVLTSKARHAPNNDKRPVYLRLTEKGKHYNESIEQLRERMGKFDNDGKRLFTPAINRDSARSVNHSFNSAQSPAAVSNSNDSHNHSFNDCVSSVVSGQSHRGDGASTAAADEFLYQDARDREERFRVREKEVQAQIESKAAASKINSSSIVLLRRKADRDAKTAFKLLTGVGEQEEGCEDLYLGIDDVQNFVHMELGGSGKWSEESLSRHTNVVWALLDTQQTGRVTKKAFVAIAAPFLLHNTPTAALQEFNTHTGANTENIDSSGAALTAAPIEDLAQLQGFLRKAVSRAQSPSAPQQSRNAFAPHIYQHSYKLASRQEKKERERIEQILAMHKSSDHDNNNNKDDQSVVSSVNGSVKDSALLDGDGLPPPPPPTSTTGAADTSRTSAKTDQGLHNRHDLLYARALIKEQNLRRMALEVAAREMEECTFRPKIIPTMPILPKHTSNTSDVANNTSVDIDDANCNDSMQADPELGSVHGGSGVGATADNGRNVNSRNRRENIHERLYGLKDKVRTGKLQETSSRMIEEMQACTFAPQLNSSFYRKGDTSTAIAPAHPTEKSQQGVVKSIERIRKANDEKLRRAKEDDHERKREQLDQSYARSRELARQGVVPFRFVLGERVEQREITSPVKRGEPDLIVDVKLGVNKTGKITIWRGDDPVELATSFARIYSLDLKARDLLVNVICQSMQQNGLLLVTPEDPRGGGNTGTRLPFPTETAEQHAHSLPHLFDAPQMDYAHVSTAGLYGQAATPGAGTGVDEASFSGSSVSGSQYPEEGEEDEGEGEEGEEGQSDNSADRSQGSGSEGEESEMEKGVMEMAVHNRR